MTTTTEIVDFDATKRQIAEAKTVEEVQIIRSKMEALVAYYKAQRDPEKARKAAEAKLFSEARIGEMLMTLKSSPGTRTDLSGGARQVPGKIETMKAAGISTEQGSQFERLAKLPKEDLAKVAHEGKSARSILRSKPPRMTPDELAAAGRSRKAERYYTEDGGSKSRIKLISDENRSLKAENAKLKEEVSRLNNDLVAIQTGQIMQMSRAALEQRKTIVAKQKTKREARAAIETVADAKTVEDYERQIKRLKDQVNAGKVRAMSMEIQRGVIKTISNAERKLLLVLLHPDRATDLADRAKREQAFKLVNSIPELVEG